MSRIISLMLVCSILAIFLTGCFDAKEITEYAYAYSIGLEKGDKDKLRLSVQIQTAMGEQGGGGKSGGVQSGGVGGSQKLGNTDVITIDCPTFYSGVNMINTFLSREINYTHTMFLVFSENLAKEGIDSYITGFVRGRQIRRSMNIIVTKGSASEFLKENNSIISSSISKKEQNLIEQTNDTGFFTDSTYGEMINAAKSNYEQPIAILAAINDESKFKEGEGAGETAFKTGGDYYAGELVRKGGSKTELLGTALFDGGKMVGELNGDETRAMLMVRNEFKKSNFVIKDPKKENSLITLIIRRHKSPDIKVNLEGDKPVIDLKVSLIGEYTSIQSNIDYESKEFMPIVEKEVEKKIKAEMDRTIKKCQAVNSDVFKFGGVVAMHFLTIPEWEKYNWKSKFKDAQVNTEVDFKIRRTGTMLKSSEMVTSQQREGELSQ